MNNVPAISYCYFTLKFKILFTHNTGFVAESFYVFNLLKLFYFKFFSKYFNC